MSMDNLKIHAALLMAELDKNKGRSQDVEWLSVYPPLLEAVKLIKEGRISIPYDLGLGKWIFESSIQDFSLLTDRLVEFDLLLRGWKLPSEAGGTIEHSD